MISRMILSRMLRDGWVPDYLEVEVPPESMVKIDFKQKLLIINMGITSPMELYMYRDRECTGYMNLSPKDFEYIYEKELIGFAEFLIFTIPVYRFKRKEPLSRLFLPVECDAITIVNRDEKVSVTVGVHMIHSPNLSLEDFNVESEKLREETSE